MLGLHDRFRELSKRPLVLPKDGVSSLITLSCATRGEVDAMNAAAVAAGGSEVHGAEDLGFMYSRAFADPDGNAFGIMWMDSAAAG
jgi:predicted lactoylglutathione lyase